MSSGDQVLLLDDGNLDDVASILQELGVEFTRAGSTAVRPDMAWPSRLLVAASAHAEALGPCDEGAGSAEGIVILDPVEAAPELDLRGLGFGYVLRRPVHAEALRLLLRCILFSGEDRRTEPRMPIGGEIWFTTNLLDRPAILLDLSTQGCRLLTRVRMGVGRRVRVQIPETLGAAEPLSLRGTIVRAGIERSGDQVAGYGVGVRFDPLDPDLRQELEWILEERSGQLATLAAERSRKSDAASQKSVDPDAGKDEVQAFGISSRGLRVGGTSLTLGDRIHVALHSDSGEPALELETVVAAEDAGGNGLLLCFEDVGAEARLRLELLLRTLPEGDRAGERDLDALRLETRRAD